MTALTLARALVWHDGVVAIVGLLILCVIAGAINYFIPSPSFPKKAAFFVLGGAAVLIVLNVLCILIDHPIIEW